MDDFLPRAGLRSDTHGGQRRRRKQRRLHPHSLPHELSALFKDWLRQHEPGRADRVLNLIRQMRGGHLNDPRFGARMRGSGPYADMIQQRFRIDCKRLGLNKNELALNCNRFIPPKADTAQMALF